MQHHEQTNWKAWNHTDALSKRMNEYGLPMVLLGLWKAVNEDGDIDVSFEPIVCNLEKKWYEFWADGAVKVSSAINRCTYWS